MQERSSNWREAQNLVDGLEEALRDHPMQGIELFIFTDNSTAEKVFWKGYSTSRELSSIVLRMRKLEMENDLLIHVVHVSGSRMVRQGTDGLSRADLSTGVMEGRRMEDFIPLHLSALDRSSSLRSRLLKESDEFGWTILDPEGWYDENHKYGNFIWAPPPGSGRHNDRFIEQSAS